jgi:shikimate dehydrogenase
MTQLRAGVIGWPIAHTKGPLLHGHWLQLHGIDGRYDRIPVRPEELAAFMQDLPKSGLRGVNITVPHKVTALDLVDDVTPAARAIGAINTVVVTPDGRLLGSNTDMFGFMENLRAGAPDFDFTAGPAVVLGAGGAARAVLAGLLAAGVPEIRLANRDAMKAADLAGRFGAAVRPVAWDGRAAALAGAHLLVNTTSLGMTGQPPLNLDLTALPPDALVHDIVYAPLITPLLAAARARGNPMVDGLGMLLHQARPGFTAWFGREVAVTPELRAAVLAG